MKIATRNKIEFPPYLAYGLAIPGSFREENGKFLQDYSLHGQHVLTATLTDDRAEIEELWQGKQHSYTTYPTLAQATQVHYMFMDQSQSPIHEFWARSLSQVGNIYVDYLRDGHNKPIFFPAVYLMTLRIPVLDENCDAALVFTQHPLVRKYGYKYNLTSLFINKTNGETHEQPIHLLEIMAPLAYIHSIAEAAVDGKVILKGKLYRAFVMAGPYGQHQSLKVWPAVNGDAWKSYGVVIKDLGSMIEDRESAA